MASRSRTTMAKLDRERKMLERRIEKQARKDVRRRESDRAAAERLEAPDVAKEPDA